MADIVTKELKVRAYVDADTGQLRLFSSEMGKVEKAVDKAGRTMGGTTKKAESMFGAFFKAALAMGAIQKGIDLVIGSLKDGIVEMNEMEEASRRMTATSKQTGIDIKILADAASAVSADNLIELDTAMQGISDLAAKGFAADQLKEMGVALEDIAASAGGNTQENFQKLVDAFTSGRVASADLARLLPTLKTNLENAGVTMADMADSTKKAQVQQAIYKTVMEQWNVVGDASSEKLKTLKGQMEAMEITTKNLKQAWAEGLIAGFQGASGDISKTAENISKLEGFVRSLGTVITTVLVVAFQALQKQIEYFITNPLGALIEAFLSFPGKLHEVEAALRVFGQNMIQAGSGMVTALKQGIEAKWGEFTGWFKEKLQKLRDMLPHSDAKEGPLSTLTAAGQAFWTTFASGLRSGEPALLSALMAGLHAVSDALGKWISGISGFLGPMIGPLVDVAITAISKLFQKDWGKEATKQVGLLIDGLKISDDLMKKITEDAKKFGNAMKAGLMNLPAIFSELGVNMQNFFQLAQAMQDVLSGVEQGILSTAEANDILAATFPALIDAAVEFGGVYLDRLNELVKMTAAAGIEVTGLKDALLSAIKEIQAKVLTQAKALNAALTPIIAEIQAHIDRLLSPDNTKPVNMAWIEQLRKDATNAAGMVLTAFNAMIAGGASAAEALAAISPNLEALRNALKEIGLTMGDVGLGFLNQLDKINKKFPESVAAINAVSAALTAMQNLGIKPTETEFMTLQRTAIDAFRQITKGHEPTRAELSLMLPLLHEMQDNALKYGYSLNPAIQHLIDLAKKNGTWKDSDPAPTLEQSMVGLLDVLEKLNLTMENLLLMLSQMPSSLPDPFRDWDVPSGEGFLQKRVPNYQHLGHGEHYVGRTELVKVHPGEKIMGKHAKDTGGNKFYEFNFYGVDEPQFRQLVKRMQSNNEF